MKEQDGSKITGYGGEGKNGSNTPQKSFSDFVQNAPEEEKKEVFERVIEESIKDQAATQSWEEEFDEKFGDKYNKVEGNSQIVATGMGMKYLKDFIHTEIQKAEERGYIQADMKSHHRFEDGRLAERTALRSYILEREAKGHEAQTIIESLKADLLFRDKFQN